MDYANLIGLGLTFLQAFLNNTQHNLPAEIAGSIRGIITGLEAHKNDVVTKAAFEAQRG